MAGLSDLIFHYGRKNPSPFEDVKTVAVASKYSIQKLGGVVNAKICSNILKGLNAVCACIAGTGKGAVATLEHKYIAEYKSKMSEDEYHIVIYNSKNGSVFASVYNYDTKLMGVYKAGRKERDCAAIMMAMFPEFDKDDEFKENFQEYCAEYAKNFPDEEKGAELAAILCDNVYRRLTDKNCPAFIKLEISPTGNIMPINDTQLASEKYMPDVVVAGELAIFQKKQKGLAGRMGNVPALADFVGKYDFHNRTFSQEEAMQIPKLPEWYILPKEVTQICQHIKATTGKNTQMRNFLMRGEAGCGKTMGAKAIAAGLNLPYMKYTCSSDTESYDFIGQIIPVTSENAKNSQETNEELQQLQEMGGITYENVAKLMNLPDLSYLEYDLDGAYEMLTGEVKEGVSVQECMQLIVERVTEKLKLLTEAATGSGTQKFSYVETDFIRAIKNGYCIEIQEPSLIMQPGVLVGLNSLLEQGGTITLPTGEVIQRHPDAVVIITTNISYEGCRALNQSLVDRISLVLDVALPPPDVMIERVMSITGVTDEYEVSRKVDVVDQLSTYCRVNHITDGCVGMRSLIDWVMSTEITGDPYESALHTVISKATTDEDERVNLIDKILSQVYPPQEDAA